MSQAKEQAHELNHRGHMDFVLLEAFDRQAYPEYAALTESERKSLPATNFWRQKNGQPLIPVPPQDKYYHYYFRDISSVNYVNTPAKKQQDLPAEGE